MTGSGAPRATRTMLITGASAGLGAGLAREFARRGYALALSARRVERLEKLAAELTAAGAPQVVVLPLDVQQTDAIAPVVQQAAAALGRLDVVVANAGVGYVIPSGRGRLDLIRETLQVNLLGAIATIEAALPIMKQQGGGQVVGITSVAGARGLPGFGTYAATKGGLHRYLQALRAEMSGTGIVVTELAPGYIDTEMNAGLSSRPFLVSADRGTAVMARLIERRVGMRFVPPFPWTLVVPLLKVLPAKLFAPRVRRS